MINKNFPVINIESEGDISDLLRADEWRMGVLTAAEKKALPDWWIGAGFLRNLIWDALEGIESEPTRDVDLVYYDKGDTRPETDWRYDDEMAKMYPDAEWEVRNQARMHYVNNFSPFTSTEDGISHWVETATCVAVKLENGTFRYLFCHGTGDLLGLVARPAPAFKTETLLPKFYTRIEEKRWKDRWPHLRIDLSSLSDGA